MQQSKHLTSEVCINNWNEVFPNHQITLASFKIPQEFMGAVMMVFDRIGYDNDYIMSSLPDDHYNNHIMYYKHILPVIKTTRIVNYYVTVSTEKYRAFLFQFLQPNNQSSLSILVLLYNLKLFYDERFNFISVHENELLKRNEQETSLEREMNDLQQTSNELMKNKSHRVERLEKLKQFNIKTKDKIKHNREKLNEEMNYAEGVFEKKHHLEMLYEQKKMQKDPLIAEVERLKVLRVYDADDIQGQMKQAVKHVQEVEEQLSALGDTLMQKENQLKYFQTTKQHLDTANCLLDEIIKQAECLKQRELETDSKEDELDVLQMELNEEQSTLASVTAAREDNTATRQQAQADRQLSKTKAHGALREAEEKEAKSREVSNRKLQRVQHTKDMFSNDVEMKAKNIEDLDYIKNNFSNELKKTEDILLKKVGNIKKQIEDKIRNRDG